MKMEWICMGCDPTKVTESVEKMRAKERFINTQHDGLREEYLQVFVCICWRWCDFVVVAVAVAGVVLVVAVILAVGIPDVLDIVVALKQVNLPQIRNIRR